MRLKKTVMNTMLYEYFFIFMLLLFKEQEDTSTKKKKKKRKGRRLWLKTIHSTNHVKS